MFHVPYLKTHTVVLTPICLLLSLVRLLDTSIVERHEILMTMVERCRHSANFVTTLDIAQRLELAHFLQTFSRSHFASLDLFPQNDVVTQRS